MGLNILSKCDLSDLTCGRLLISSTYTLFVFASAVFFIVKIYKVQRKLTYEVCPMITCAMLSLLHIVFYLIYEDNRMSIVNNYIQVITFSFIAQGFAHLYYRIKIDDEKKFRAKFGKFVLITSIVYATLFVGMVYATSQAAPKTCNVYYQIGQVIILVDMLFTSLVSVVYGYRLLKLVNRLAVKQTNIKFKARYQNQNSDPKLAKASVDSFGGLRKVTPPLSITEVNPQSLIVNEDSSQLMDIRKQIKIVTSALVLTALSYVIMSPYIFAIVKNDICDLDVVDSSIQISTVLALISFVQITPCLLIPYAFCSVPIVERDTIDLRHSLDFDENIVISSNGLSNSFRQSTEDLFVKQAQKK